MAQKTKKESMNSYRRSLRTTAEGQGLALFTSAVALSSLGLSQFLFLHVVPGSCSFNLTVSVLKELLVMPHA